MTFTSNHLTVKALLALELAWEECRAEPLPRSPYLRFVLAYLFSRSDGSERWLFDQFWVAVTRPAADKGNDYGDMLARSNNATAALNGIYRVVGVERTNEMAFSQAVARSKHQA